MASLHSRCPLSVVCSRLRESSIPGYSAAAGPIQGVHVTVLVPVPGSKSAGYGSGPVCGKRAYQANQNRRQLASKQQAVSSSTQSAQHSQARSKQRQLPRPLSPSTTKRSSPQRLLGDFSDPRVTVPCQHGQHERRSQISKIKRTRQNHAQDHPGDLSDTQTP